MWIEELDALLMEPWDVIEGALARRKPPRDQAWLATQLGIRAQAVTNWKTRGVPKTQYEALADLLGLSLEQIAGRAPPPWEAEAGGWPFPDIDSARWARLTELQKGEIQAKVRELIAMFESRRDGLGKSIGSK